MNNRLTRRGSRRCSLSRGIRLNASVFGYKTADVRAVPLAKDGKSEFVPATAEYVYTGDYPLSRFLWVYISSRPGGQLDPLRREFVKFIFSKQGQEVVIKDGYFPVSAGIAKKNLEKLGIE